MKIQVFTLLSLGVAFAVNGPSLGASQSDTAVGLGLQLATGFENTPGRFGTDRNVTSEPTSLNGMPGSGFGYVIETSLTDPEGCAAPLAAFDGMPDAYVNLEAFGILTDPGISGDTVWFSVDFSGGEFDFWGQPQGELINFTDDGFAFFDPSTPGPTPWVHEPIPTMGDPDSLMAIFWRDMEIVYDGASNRGVSLANLTSGGVPIAGVIEFDDVEDWPAGGNPTYDIEIVAYYEASPDRYEYIFAYDNLTGPVTVGTIGLESQDGTDGAEYAYNSILVTNGMAVCFDLTEDTDGDGVLDIDDFCLGTSIPEAGVPSVRLGVNRWALTDGDGLFDTRNPQGRGPGLSYSIEDTGGCSCEQIIEAWNLGRGHTRFGCSISVMDDWVAFVSLP